MSEKYKPETLDAALTRVAEECAEVIQAVCKAQRFGLDNYHPDHPHESNLHQIIREATDIKEAVDHLFTLWSKQ